MVSSPKGEQANAAARRDEARRAEESLDLVVRDRVLQALGAPTQRYEVRVKRLWASHYRVNVIVGDDWLKGSIAHSYFLVSDDAGNILESSPRLTRKY